MEFLRSKKIGTASFFILEKNKDLRNRYSSPFTVPEGTIKIFDILKIKSNNPMVKSLFFQTFGNTLICKDL